MWFYLIVEMMKENVKAFIKRENLIRPKEKVLAAVSGGADSVCLMLLLHELQEELDFDLEVIHVEHGIRGAQSLQDAEFVRKLCRSRNIPFHIVTVDAPAFATKEKLGLEEAARILRYQSLKETACSCKADKIALAHHAGDQAETILFHLVRGSDIRGLRGMLPKRSNLIRPLLESTRQEIEEYLANEKQSYRVDATNSSDAYARNRIRLHVIPQLEQINEQAVHHITQAAATMREAESYLALSVEEAMKQCFRQVEEQKGVVDLRRFKKLHPYIASFVMYQIIADMTGHNKDLTKTHVQNAMALAEAQSGKRISIYRGLMITKEYESLIFERDPQKVQQIEPALLEVSKDGSYTLQDGTILRWRKFDYDASTMEIPKNRYTKWYDYDKIKNRLVVRNRQESDYLVIDSKGHKKRLQDYFVNQKIPAGQRQLIPLVAEGNHILWVIGYRGSEGYRITETTSKILEIVIDGGN
ncbi:tRNA lysidine(34) synthetase TilS [Eubacterium oxidoreducens]|uniref:tRNA lysidine(34) synthetase TilS n=1 Tax=Eubacterium oxidoreducens TaxID=1732 RepID=UPI000B7E9042|nr:tRNA lysidine(34) synthetase TilS [Eubacterium oxidoreducens]